MRTEIWGITTCLDGRIQHRFDDPIPGEPWVCRMCGCPARDFNEDPPPATLAERNTP